MGSDDESEDLLKVAYTSELFTAINLLRAGKATEDETLNKIKTCQRNGADVNAINRNDKECNTVLHTAIRHRFQRIVALLLEYEEIKTDLENGDGQTALTLAISADDHIKSLVNNHVHRSSSSLKLTFSNNLNVLLNTFRNRRHILKLEIQSCEANSDFLYKKEFFEAIDSCTNLIFVDVNTSNVSESAVKAELAAIRRSLLFQCGPVEDKNVYFRDSETDEIIVTSLNSTVEAFGDEIFCSKLSSGIGFGLKFILNALQVNVIGSFIGPYRSITNVYIELEKVIGNCTVIRHVIKNGDLLTFKLLCFKMNEEMPFMLTARYGNREKMSALLTMSALMSNEPHSMPENHKNILLKAAVDAGNVDIAKLMIEEGAKPSQSIVDSAYDTGRYAIVLMLLKADSVFPISFDLEKVNGEDELTNFVNARDELHTFIENGDLARVQSAVRLMDRSKTYLNKDGHSAVWTALSHNHIRIFVWLKIEMEAELRDDDETSGLSSGILEIAKEALASTCVSIDDAHILYLVSKSKSALPKQDFKEIIESYYKTLDQIPQVSIVLKLIQYGNQLDIIYDMETDSIKNTSLTTSLVKGECDYLAGRIYIGGKRDESELLGTVAHELSHLAMQILFNNDTKPYCQNTHEQTNKYKRVVDIVRRKKFGADEIINKVFSTYSEQSIDSELIVTVNHMLGKYGHEEGTQLLLTQTPELLEYYTSEIIPRCEEFIKDSHQLNLRNSIKLLNDYSGVLNFLQETKVHLKSPPRAPCNSTGTAINCIITDFVLLSSIKVFSALKNDIGSLLIFDYDQYLTRRATVHTFFNYGVCNTLILICQSQPEETKFKQSARMLLSIVQQKINKQVIIVKKNDVELGSDFEVTIDVPFSSDELTGDSIRMLLERTVSLQNCKLKLERLIDEVSFHMVDAQTLTKLISREEVQIGNKMVTDSRYDGVKNYYVQRKFYGNLRRIGHQFQKYVSKFYVTRDGQVDEKTFSKFFNFSDIVSVSDSDANFLTLCTNHRGRNIHWLKMVEEEFVWQKSEGELTKLCEYADAGKWETLTCDPETIRDKIVIVVAEAGMGKSTVLSHLAMKIKADDTEAWVARINLVDYSAELNKLKAANVHFNEIEAVKFLYNCVGFHSFKEKQDETGEEREAREQMIQDIVNSVVLKRHEIALRSDKENVNIQKTFEIELFNSLYNRGKLVLLFDGFDEISPDYKAQVIQLFGVLKGTKVAKLWVTTRPYDVQSELEAVLGTFSYSLIPFDTEDQKQFLKRFWEKKFRRVKFDSKRLTIFIDELLSSFSISIKDYERKFVSIPLQIQMIAEVYQNEFKEFCDTKSGTCDEKFTRRLNLVNLFKTFFDIKFFKILYGTKAKQINVNDTNIKSLLDKEYKEVVKRHEELAIYTLFNSKQRLSLFSIKKRDRVLGFVEVIKQCKEKTGIIDRIVDGRPFFVHQTFAEYFAALWFVRKRHKSSVRDFLSSSAFREQREVVQNFFDLMLADDERCQLHVAVINKDVKIMVELLCSRKMDIRAVDKGGRTAMHLAAGCSDEEVIKLLLDYKAGVNVVDNIFNWKPVTYADRCRNWAVAELLLQNGANGEDMFETVNNVNKHVMFNGQRTPTLHVAAGNGYIKLVQLLIASGVNLNVQDSFYYTALHLAVINGHLEIVKVLTENNAGLNVKDEFGNSPLHLAINKGYVEIVKYLVDNHAVLSVINDSGRTALDLAAEKGDLEMVRHLVEQKALECLRVSKQKKGPLHLAAERGHLAIVSFLVDNKMDVNARDDCGRTSLLLAAEKGYLEIVKCIVEGDARINLQNKNGDTPVNVAAENGHLDVVKYMVENGADVNIQNLRDKSPLHCAVEMGDLKLMQLLVHCDADLNVVNEYGKTPLIVAIEADHFEIAEYLVEHHADSSARTGCGLTPLHLAVENGNWKMVKCLVDNNVNTNVKNMYYEAPLHLAVDKGDLEMVKYLVKNNADVNIKNEYGKGPLHLGVENGHLQIVICLVEKNANINIRDIYEQTPVHIAAEKGNLEMVKYLVNKGAIVTALDYDGWAALHFAVFKGALDVVKYFVNENGVDVNSRVRKYGNLKIKHHDQNCAISNKDTVIASVCGVTTLHLAAYCDNLDVLKFLVDEKQIDVNARDRYGFTPLQLAMSYNKENALGYLMDKTISNSPL